MEIKEIKKGVKISNGLSTEAKLYLYDGVLYKIFENASDIRVRENVLNELRHAPINGCPRIYSLLYDYDFIGYGMEYLKNYIPLIKVKKLPLEAKKLYIHKLIELYNELKDMGYIYWDFHERNVLVDFNELRLVDVDSCLYNTRENDVLGTCYLNELILSILFDCKFFEIKPYFLESERHEILNTLYSGLSYTYKEKGSLEELDEYTEEITDKKIKSIKKRLPKAVLK